MSDHRPDEPDDNDTVIRQEPNDEKTRIRKQAKSADPTEAGGEATVLREPVASGPIATDPEGSTPDRSENATIMREPVASGNATILREPGGGGNATILREPSLDGSATIIRSQSSGAPSNDHATILRGGDLADGDGDSTVMRSSGDDDSTIMNPSHDDDSTIIGERATSSDTTYIASVGRQIESKGNSEAGRLLKNRFVLEEKVGSGGMGDVYKALDLRAQEAQERNPYIAIKLLNENFARHKDAFMSLQREAQKTRNIPHKNIMGVYDFDREGDTVYMTMELLTGKPLDDYLKEHPEGVSVEDAWNIIDGISQGLSRAHGAGIVHSDFKPGNIFYTSDKMAKVFDFGIARAVSNPGEIEADGEKTVFDAASLGALTPTYASYEMLKGMEPSKSDDVYAVALVAYELFTGKHPYDRVPADKALDRGMKPAPVPFLKRRHWKALRQGLELKREERTQTIDEFHEGMFSEDPPVLRNTAIAVVLLASIGFGAYQTFYGGDEKANPELVALQAERQQTQTILESTLNRNDWKSIEWHQDINKSFKALGKANLVLQEDWTDDLAPEELDNLDVDIEKRKQDIIGAYLNKIRDLRELATPLPNNDWESVQQALELLVEAEGYLAVVEDYKYSLFDPAEVGRERGSLDTALQLRRYTDADFAEKKQAADEAEAARIAAQQLREEQLAEEQRIYDAYGVQIADLKEILRCKGNIPSDSSDVGNYRDPGISDTDWRPNVRGDELTLLGTTLRKLAQINPTWYERDEENIARAIAGCIATRIAVARPDRAREVKARVMTYLPDEPLIANIEISDRDPCKKRNLEGQGTRNRSWCEDPLTEGNITGPQLVVVPQPSQQAHKFAISRTEIKIADYNQFCTYTGCQKLNEQRGSLPATNLSVAQAKAYAEWLSAQSGRTYRLPTVEEWHYAAMTDDYGGVDANINCTVDSRGVRLGEKLLSALSGRPNSWGLYNHVGNAREWAEREDGTLVAVGGAHTDPKSECSIEKSVAHSGQPDPVTGFRIVRQIDS